MKLKWMSALLILGLSVGLRAEDSAPAPQAEPPMNQALPQENYQNLAPEQEAPKVQAKTQAKKKARKNLKKKFKKKAAKKKNKKNKSRSRKRRQ